MRREEKNHLARVAALGCIVCRNEGHCFSPASIHHLTGQGMGRHASHFETIPLCLPHHQNGPRGAALHKGVKTWEARYGTQREPLEKVRELLKEAA